MTQKIVTLLDRDGGNVLEEGWRVVQVLEKRQEAGPEFFRWYLLVEDTPAAPTEQLARLEQALERLDQHLSKLEHDLWMASTTPELRARLHEQAEVLKR